LTDLARPPRHPRRLVYLGTPDLAVPPLRALHAEGYEIVLVVSRADKRRGRGTELLASPVKAAALELGLPVSASVDDVLACGADLGVVVAYGRLIKPDILERIPMVNLHFSLLPRWRGAAPVERAILANDTVTGVCIMALEEGLDTGGIYAQAEVAIDDEVTLDELRAELVTSGTDLLLGVLGSGLGEPVPQQGEPTYAGKIDPAERELDFSASAAHLTRVVRVGDAFTFFKGRRLKVWKAKASAGSAPAGTFAAPLVVGTGDGLFELVEVQPEGKPRMAAAAWANGTRPHVGDRLGR
jgi:methionyl-tRNA formyltransferase